MFNWGNAIVAALVVGAQGSVSVPPVAQELAQRPRTTPEPPRLPPPEQPRATTRPAAADGVTGQVLTYKHGDVELRGYLAYEKTIRGKRPGVLVVPEWWGLNDFAMEEARQLAALGYVALAVDMYGNGRITLDPAEAGRLAGQFRENQALWRERARAAYDALAREEHCDPGRIAAIGFCFGGSTVLQLAASGTNLAAVVSFHGSLMPIAEADAARIKARVLVLHGAADPHVPDESLKAFEDSLRKTDVDWQLIAYGGAKHGFMNPAANGLGMEGIGYDERTARRAWEQMRLFLQEVFGSQRS